MNRGFSIGIGDVTPSQKLLEQKQNLLKAGLVQCFTLVDEIGICSTAVHYANFMFFLAIKNVMNSSKVKLLANYSVNQDVRTKKR